MVGADHHLVDQRLLDPAVPRRPTEHLRAKSTRPPQLDGADRWQMFTTHHLAADLAGHRALPDHPAHPAAEDLRPGLPVLAWAAAPTRPWCWCSTSTSRPSCTTRAATPRPIAVALFVIVIAFSVLQFQALRARGAAMSAAADTQRSPAVDAPAAAARIARHRRRSCSRSSRVIFAVDLVLPALLGARHQLQDRRRGGRPGIRSVARDVRRSTATSTSSRTRICRSGTSTRSSPRSRSPSSSSSWRACCGYAISQLRFPGPTAALVRSSSRASWSRCRR